MQVYEAIWGTRSERAGPTEKMDESWAGAEGRGGEGAVDELRTRRDDGSQAAAQGRRARGRVGRGVPLLPSEKQAGDRREQQTPRFDGQVLSSNPV
jgi:hypothetical protein